MILPSIYCFPLQFKQRGLGKTHFWSLLAGWQERENWQSQQLAKLYYFCTIEDAAL